MIVVNKLYILYIFNKVGWFLCNIAEWAQTPRKQIQKHKTLNKKIQKCKHGKIIYSFLHSSLK